MRFLSAPKPITHYKAQLDYKILVTVGTPHCNQWSNRWLLTICSLSVRLYEWNSGEISPVMRKFSTGPNSVFDGGSDREYIGFERFERCSLSC